MSTAPTIGAAWWLNQYYDEERAMADFWRACCSRQVPNTFVEKRVRGMRRNSIYGKRPNTESYARSLSRTPDRVAQLV